MARFLVDEDLPRSLAPALRGAGISVEDVRVRFPLGSHHGIVVARFPNDLDVVALITLFWPPHANSPTPTSPEISWSSNRAGSASHDAPDHVRLDLPHLRAQQLRNRLIRAMGAPQHVAVARPQR
jgi:hypothetical protein